MTTIQYISPSRKNQFVSVLLTLMLMGFSILVTGKEYLQTATRELYFPMMWNTGDAVPADVYTAFRGKFSLDRETKIEMLVSGSSWYVIWLNGEYFFEGPDRYHPNHPEYQVKTVSLPAGEHLLAVQVHYEGVDTRIMKDIQPFLMLQLSSDDNQQVPVTWNCMALPGYDSQFLRISPQLGWIEWVDTRQLPIDWQKAGFDDGNWGSPVFVERHIGNFTASKIANVISTVMQPALIDSGPLAEVFGYERDNISARFFLRDLDCEELPPQGIWRRYDLGRVRLSRPKFVMDLPAGTLVQFAYSEQLYHGRVSPWITLSLSDTYNMDHFVARGGVQEFFPIKPKGGRFMEVHIMAPEDQVTIISDHILDRCYYDEINGSFSSGDALLDRIWEVGIDTYLGCAEDALTDNPTRERGQWLGDFGIVGMQIGSVGFHDIGICRRGLVQSAQSARSDGMVAGLCPGGEAYLSTYAAQWVSACMEYWKVTGDKSILEELFVPAQRNMEAFSLYFNEHGISHEAGWPFVDWGYVPNEGPSDMGLNLHVYMATRAMQEWAMFMGEPALSSKYEEMADRLYAIIAAYFNSHRKEDGYNWPQIGYHRTVLGILTGFIPESHHDKAVGHIKEHIMNCFPNNPDAPRLSDPGANNPQLITPYFSHYTFPVLIENGEMDFVLDQYKTSWGWMLEGDKTTWIEVYDTRWSHCHQWAGSPTWQMSRYLLGLHPRFHIAENNFDLVFHPGSLTQSEGTLPLPNGGKVDVKWETIQGEIHYELTTTVPLVVNVPESLNASVAGATHVTDRLYITIPQ
jgi:alpha-L-rhamnosidase